MTDSIKFNNESQGQSQGNTGNVDQSAKDEYSTFGTNPPPELGSNL